MRTIAAIMFAGSIGAAARYGVDGWVTQHLGNAFPWGTLAVNISASILLGLVFTLSTERAGVDTSTRLALTTGLIGSYSTFSTLMLESVRLVERGSIGVALLNLGGSVGAGMLGLTLGIFAARAVPGA